MLNWVEQNLYTCADISTLVCETGYSRKTLELWFLRHYDMTPGDYLSRRRMSRAALLLRMTKLPVMEISSLFHFYSPQNFARAFKLKFGVTPMQYRKQDKWSLHMLQKPLLTEMPLLKPEVVTLGELKMCALDVIDNHNFLSPTENNDVFEKTKSLVHEYLANNYHDICFGYKVRTRLSALSARNTTVSVEVLTQYPHEEGEYTTVILPAGKYVQFCFSGTWNEYAVFTWLTYFRMAEEKDLRVRRDGFDLTFFSVPAGHNEEVSCRHLIPVD
ncbi:helix-turn-helix domain-containing protein [Citrobacter sp. On28M]|uniref:helix-turn-helix domain-containing protein n=1 Tax=Citrobacter sp. On28M TaxID=2678565 RepID=UPI001C5DDDCA|nr:helix-turn-helix domain-containing protein [Citrobacter sp. On28M]MBW5276044.1 helix-turn-helix domain-containing protein [Citrobacter sp. On28M]